MSNDNDSGRSQADADLEREIRNERKFTLEEAIGRLAGPGAMKGASPVARKQQAESAIETWLRLNMPMSQAELQVVLLRCVSQSTLLLNNYDQPLTVLAGYCQQVLGSDNQLKDLVREADIEWGRVFDERPCLDKDGCAPQPDDPYTFESVRKSLCGVMSQLAADNDAARAG
jgi:hypothetical protein